MTTDLAIFLPSLGGGGAEKVMLSLAGEFASRGIRTDIVIAMSGGSLMKDLPSTVNLVELGHRKTTAATLSLARYLRRSKPRTLLPTVFSCNVTALAAHAISGVPTRIVPREASPTERDVIASSRVGTMANIAAARLLYRRADAAIAISEGVRKSLAKFHWLSRAKIHVIPNPLPASATGSHDPPRQGRPVIVACGRLEPQKDYPTLLKAFALLRRTMDVELSILGEGFLHESLAALAEELGVGGDVVFHGFQSDPYAYFQRASLFAHTARYEGFGVVFLEAMACGCPIVATDCEGGVREVLDNGRFGSLVPVGNVQGFATAMEDVLTGKVKLDDPRTHLRKYSLESIADAYLKVLFPDNPEPSIAP